MREILPAFVAAYDSAGIPLSKQFFKRYKAAFFRRAEEDYENRIQGLCNDRVYGGKLLWSLSYASSDSDSCIDEILKNQYNFLIKNANNDSVNSKKYNNDPNFWLSSIFEYKSSLPLIKNNETLKPTVSLRLSPNKSRDNSQKDKRVDINNIYSLNRTSESDSVEGGGSITYGVEYNKSDYLSDRDIFTAKVANIFRPKEDVNLPRSSRIGQKTSDIVGNINLAPSHHFKINYDFSLDQNLKDSNYQLISNEISINNFINTFEYLNENNTNSSESYLANKFAYNFNEEKKLSFNTRINKKTNLTEFYNLIYQYTNDCLVAAIEYNKDYYSDRDLKPEENVFFKLTIIPFGETKSPNLIK
jgi:LPS-assembly protein